MTQICFFGQTLISLLGNLDINERYFCPITQLPSLHIVAHPYKKSDNIFVNKHKLGEEKKLQNNT
jgi:hypothetical protein